MGFMMTAVVLGAVWFGSSFVSGMRESSLTSALGQEASFIDTTTVRFIAEVGKIVVVTLVACGIVQLQTNSDGEHSVHWESLTAAAGVVIGLATQDTLSNLCAGVLLVFTRPFAIGDKVAVAGVTGFVVGIGVFHTVINSVQHERYLIPNAKVFKERLHNMSYLHVTRCVVNVSTPRAANAAITRAALLTAVTKVHAKVQQAGSGNESDAGSDYLIDKRSPSPGAANKTTAKRLAGIRGRGRTLDQSRPPAVFLKNLTPTTAEWMLQVSSNSSNKVSVQDMMLTEVLAELEKAAIPQCVQPLLLA